MTIREHAPESRAPENAFGRYLRGRRARLDPAAFGILATRRRTPGLRREEVAQRANVSVTWYIALEQGRGGSPSADVLERLAGALALTADEREHLFLLAQRRAPEVRYLAPTAVTPQLQRMLDALDCSPAFVKTARWDVVAWNRAAAAVLTDYGALAPERRNILLLMFCDPAARERLTDWEEEARGAVAAFRSEVVRAGASEQVAALVDELSQRSVQFAALWRDHAVRASGEGTKQIRTSDGGLVMLEHSAFSADGRPDLGLVVYTPATPADRDRVLALIEANITRC